MGGEDDGLTSFLGDGDPGWGWAVPRLLEARSLTVEHQYEDRGSAP